MIPVNYYKICPKVLNNTPDMNYHSRKGVLVVPRRLKKRENRITVNGKKSAVNEKDKPVINQRKRLSDYLSNLYKLCRNTTRVDYEAPVDKNIKVAKNLNLWS